MTTNIVNLWTFKRDSKSKFWSLSTPSKKRNSFGSYEANTIYTHRFGGGVLGQKGVRRCSAGQGTFFHLHSPRKGRKNTKIEESVPCRVPFLENLGKK